MRWRSVRLESPIQWRKPFSNQSVTQLTSPIIYQLLPDKRIALNLCPNQGNVTTNGQQPPLLTTQRVTETTQRDNELTTWIQGTRSQHTPTWRINELRIKPFNCPPEGNFIYNFPLPIVTTYECCLITINMLLPYSTTSLPNFSYPLSGNMNTEWYNHILPMKLATSPC